MPRSSNALGQVSCVTLQAVVGADQERGEKVLLTCAIDAFDVTEDAHCLVAADQLVIAASGLDRIGFNHQRCNCLYKVFSGECWECCRGHWCFTRWGVVCPLTGGQLLNGTSSGA